LFDPDQLTAAHRSLPFGTMLKVTNLATGASVTVRINDRGPFVAGRLIDLSEAAARRIGLLATGTARVRLNLAGDSATAAPMSSGGVRTIQVAAFGNQANAVKLAGLLLDQGLNPSIEAAGPAGPWRVILAGVPDAQVPVTVERLRALGIDHPLLRQH
jgi:rare lipoprotein A